MLLLYTLADRRKVMEPQLPSEVYHPGTSQLSRNTTFPLLSLLSSLSHHYNRQHYHHHGFASWMSFPTPMYFSLGLSFLSTTYTSVPVPRLLSILISGNQTICFANCVLPSYFCFILGIPGCFLLAAIACDRYITICYTLRLLLQVEDQAPRSSSFSGLEAVCPLWCLPFYSLVYLFVDPV